jgi:transcriptional regulator with XRE-family HTH domain
MPVDVHEQLAHIGAQLRNARLMAGLAQDEVGRRAGVSRQLLSRIESGHPHGEISAVVAVADALDYQLSVVPKTVPSTGEQAALDLISRLRAQPAGDDR